jgi:hypothetical protein
MNKAPNLRETPELPAEIRKSALDGNLVLFVGAGVSMLVNLPSWNVLAQKVLTEFCKEGYINYSELEQLKDLDPKKQLSIAETIASENGAKLELVISKYLTPREGSNIGIYNYLNKIGCVCVTTNYDELLSPSFHVKSDASTTAATTRRISHKEEFHAGLLNEPGTVIHLHGSVSYPDTMILTTEEYLEHYDDKIVQHFLRELFDKKTVLFMGYGLDEAEILEHILRRAGVKHTDEKKRFALQGFFISQEPLYLRLYDYYEKSFGINLIGYIRDYKDYAQLEDISKTWAEQIEVRPAALVDELDFMREVLQ